VTVPRSTIAVMEPDDIPEDFDEPFDFVDDE
jgi:hypothetical protein